MPELRKTAERLSSPVVPYGRDLRVPFSLPQSPPRCVFHIAGAARRQRDATCNAYVRVPCAHSHVNSRHDSRSPWLHGSECETCAHANARARASATPSGSTTAGRSAGRSAGLPLFQPTFICFDDDMTWALFYTPGRGTAPDIKKNRRLNEFFLWGMLRISLGLVDLSRIQHAAFFSGGPSWLEKNG